MALAIFAARCGIGGLEVDLHHIGQSEAFDGQRLGETRHGLAGQLRIGIAAHPLPA